jgi:endogenous inhibitor of DNA gyrase (YacG/DUF329 family)
MTTPLQWFDCPTCGGEGTVEHSITVYERGCGFPHADAVDRKCPECGGCGGWVGEAEHHQEAA